MTFNALLWRYESEIIATQKFQRSLPRCAQCAVTEDIEADGRLMLPWKRNLEVGLM